MRKYAENTRGKSRRLVANGYDWVSSRVEACLYPGTVVASLAAVCTPAPSLPRMYSEIQRHMSGAEQDSYEDGYPCSVEEYVHLGNATTRS